MSILKIKDLVHKYVTYGDTEEDKQEIAAIDHIDINVEKGEFVAILGKNGSGKSSLAKHINGLLMPTEGTVYIKGMDTKDEKYPLKKSDRVQESYFRIQITDRRNNGRRRHTFGPETSE